MSVRFRWGIAALGAAGIVLAACGGSGEADTPAPSPTHEPAGSAAATELRALVAKAEQQTFQATYDAQVAGDELSGSGTLVLAQEDGREATRLSLIEADGIPFTEIVLIGGGEKTTACFGDGDRGTCLKASGAVGETFPNPLDLQSLLDQVTGDGDVTRLPDEAPGGIPSQCYQSTSEGREGVACFAAESGIPTRLEATSDGSMVVVVVREIAATVDQGVFDTPKDYVTLGR